MVGVLRGSMHYLVVILSLGPMHAEIQLIQIIVSKLLNNTQFPTKLTILKYDLCVCFLQY